MVPASLRALWVDDRARVIVMASIIAMVAVNQIGTGILFSLIPVKLAADGYPASAAGGISTVFSLCFLAGCIVGPRIIALVGPARTPALIAGANVVLALLHWGFPGPFSWSLFRGAGGIVTATYFVLIESWLSAQATPATRGLVFGFYMVGNRLAFALGQIVIAYVDPASLMQLFLVAAVAYFIAPMLQPRSTTTLPTMTAPSVANYLELPRMAPAAAAAAMMHGLVFGSVPGLVPKWGVDAGISVEIIAKMLAAMQLGGLFMQLPISYASDRFERRTVMATTVLMTAVMSLVVLQMPADTRGGWLVVMFLWGGFSSTMYSLAVAHAGDLAPPEKRVAWVSSIMLLWGTGATLGPLVASLLMDTVGAATLWNYSAAVSVVICAFLLWRKVVRR